MPAYVWLDCGRPCVVNVLHVHNWFHESYPASVEIAGSTVTPVVDWRAALLLLCAGRYSRDSAFAALPTDVTRIIARFVYCRNTEDDCVPLGASALSMGSVWHDVNLNTSHGPLRYFRLTFPAALGPASPMLRLGVVQLVSTRKQ